MESNTKKNYVIITVISLVVGAGLGYGGAHLFNKPAAPGTGAAFARGGAAGGFMARTGTGPAGSGFLSGTVAKMDSASITLNTRDGSSHVVLLTSATTVSKSVTGSLADVTVGSNVLITGTSNADGSLTGTAIQLQNDMRAGAQASPR